MIWFSEQQSLKAANSMLVAFGLLGYFIAPARPAGLPVFNEKLF